ncbi:MAG TPA: hypothetical protein DD417_05385 [Elusimicrobia bacterium]|nr:hypothetical protein [Elusimicrobiota bacterium]
MTFDGLPWLPDEFRDPYQHLFEEDPDGRRTRMRELAVGLLTVLRLRPDHVSVMFTANGSEFVLQVESLLSERLEHYIGPPLEEQRRMFGPGAQMNIFVSLTGSHDQELAFLEEYCRHCPVKISVGTRPLRAKERELPPFLSRAFTRGGVSGELEVPPGAPETSTIELVTRGVRMAVERPRLPGLQVTGFVRDDGLRKSLSQTGIVHDDRYQRALDAVSDASAQLLDEAAGLALSAAPDVGVGLSQRNFRCWMPWVKPTMREQLGMFLYPGLSPKPIQEDKQGFAMFRMSVFVAALRASTLQHRIEMLKDAPGIPERLWDAPVLFESDGKALTLRVLERQRRWLGHVPYSRDKVPSFAAGRVTAAWIVRDADLEFLEAFFPSQVLELDVGARVPTVRSRPVLDADNLLARASFAEGQASGEAALSLSPHPASSQIRWLSNGTPLGVSVWPLDGLRLEAVVENPALSEAPEPAALASGAFASSVASHCLGAIMSAVPALYRDLGLLYRAEEETPRQAVIREHLLDLFCRSWDPARKDCGDHPWLAEAALLRDARGKAVSLKDLRAAHDAGTKLVLDWSPHPRRQRGVFSVCSARLRGLLSASGLIEAMLEDKAPPAAEAPVRRPVRSAPMPSAPATPAAPERAPAAPFEELAGAGPERLEGGLRAWFSELSARGACPLPVNVIAALRVGAKEGGKLLWSGAKGTPGFVLNAEHPLVRGLVAGPALRDTLPYAASVCFSGFNRLFKDISDAEDEQFILGLLDLALERTAGDHG